jgi:hypothetical protein
MKQSEGSITPFGWCSAPQSKVACNEYLSKP